MGDLDSSNAALFLKISSCMGRAWTAAFDFPVKEWSALFFPLVNQLDALMIPTSSHRKKLRRLQVSIRRFSVSRETMQRGQVSSGIEIGPINRERTQPIVARSHSKKPIAGPWVAQGLDIQLAPTIPTQIRVHFSHSNQSTDNIVFQPRGGWTYCLQKLFYHFARLR